MGTDVALMLGSPIRWWKMVGTTKRFWRVATGYAVFASYLLGESDGIAKRRMGGRDLWCWRSEIRELAAIFHQNTTMLMAGWGMQRQQFGGAKHWMLVTLAAMLGQIGTPGGGFGLSYHFANGGNPIAALRCSLPCRAACRVAPMR